jgi:hypothetical protein
MKIIIRIVKCSVTLENWSVIEVSEAGRGSLFWERPSPYGALVGAGSLWSCSVKKEEKVSHLLLQNVKDLKR